MVLNFNKGQAALEFLTTYGWAFLVILIMIGSLAYFGILSPGKILPSRCNFGAEFQCLDYQIAGGTINTFKLRLKSNVGEPVDVTSIILGSESTTAYSCATPPALPTGWGTGEIKDLTWSGCNTAVAGMTQGEKGKVLVAIKYNSVISGPGYTREVKGEVYSSVI